MNNKILWTIGVAAIVLASSTGCRTSVGKAADSLLFKRTEVEPPKTMAVDNIATNDLHNAVIEAKSQGLNIAGTNYTTLVLTNQAGARVEETVAQLQLVKPAVYKYEPRPATVAASKGVLSFIPGGGAAGAVLGWLLTGIAAYRTAKSRGDKVIKAVVEGNEESRRVLREELQTFNENSDPKIDIDDLDRKVMKGMKRVHQGQNVLTTVMGYVEKFTGHMNNR